MSAQQKGIGALAVLRKHRSECGHQDCSWCAELDGVIEAFAGLIDAAEPLEELWANDCDMDYQIQRVAAALRRAGGGE